MNKRLLLETATQPEGEINDWQKVDDALCRLNGTTETWVSLQFASDGTLVAAGGNNARHVVWHSVGRDSYEPTRHLIETSLDGPDIELNTSQGLDPYPAEMCVHFSTVVQALQYFYIHDGQPDPKLTWQNDW